MNTFGLRMMYPGTILKSLIGKALVEGRARFIEKKRGYVRRAYIQTGDAHKNKIDTLFVDQRNVVRSTNYATLDQQFESGSNGSGEPNGNTLVICCDGNASFYEVGCLQLPVDKGYSALGWNYPGFGESTVSERDDI